MLWWLLACGMGPVNLDVSRTPPDQLSEMNLFRWEEGELTWNEELFPYEVNTPLFSDHAVKTRALYLPEGTAMNWEDEAAFSFPVGAAMVKNFAFPADLRSPDEDVRLVETRLMLNTERGWYGYPYLWDEAQQDAVLKVSGRLLTVDVLDEQGEALSFPYLVPQRNQCIECHLMQEGDDEVQIPIGPKARHLDREVERDGTRENQLQTLIDRGWLEGAPSLDGRTPATDYDEVLARGVDDLSEEEVVTAARDYLDINCAHCHNPDGVQGVSSQLFLNHDNEDQFHLGVCKKPGSAGEGALDLDYDIVPGDPDASILVYRMETDELGAMMPLIGRALTDEVGVTLVRRWIEEMEPDDCE